MVIYLEDVHPGEPCLWSWVETQIKILIKCKEKVDKPMFLKTFIGLTGAMAMSKHSRFYSHIRKLSQESVPKAWRDLLKIPSEFSQVEQHISGESTHWTTVDGVSIVFWRKELGKREKWLAHAASSVHTIFTKTVPDNTKMIVEASSLVTFDVNINETPEFFNSEYVKDLHTKEGSRLVKILIYLCLLSLF